MHSVGYTGFCAITEHDLYFGYSLLTYAAITKDCYSCNGGIPDNILALKGESILAYSNLSLGSKAIGHIQGADGLAHQCRWGSYDGCPCKK